MLRISKRLLSLLLALTLILSMTTVAFAKDYDIINKNTRDPKDFFDLVDDIDFFADVLDNPDQYVIEVNGKYYEVEQVDAATKDGTLIDEAVVDLLPVDLDTEEELKVVSVSAINVNQVKVVFNQAVDTETASFELKRGAQNFTIADVEWNEAEDTAVLTSAVSNLNTGATDLTYTVIVSGLTDESIVETVVFEPVTATSVVITSDNVVLADNAPVKFEVRNQYDTDMKINSNDSDITGLAYNVTQSKPHVLTTGAFQEFRMPGTFSSGPDAEVGDQIRITITYKDLAVQKVIPVIAGVQASEISLGEAQPADGKTMIFQSDTNIVIPYDIKDQYGDDYTLTANSANAAAIEVADGIRFTSSNTAVVPNTNIKTDAEGNLIISAFSGTGTVKITGIINATGAIASTTFEVKADPALETLTIYEPTEIVAANDGTVKLDYVAEDQYGNVLDWNVAAEKALIQAFTNSTSTAPTVVAANGMALNADGEIVVTLAGGTGEVTLTATDGVSKEYGSVTFEVLAAAEPTTIAGLKDFTANVSEGVATNLKVENLIVKDQYGRDYELSGTEGAKAYFKSGSSTALTIAANSGAVTGADLATGAKMTNDNTTDYAIFTGTATAGSSVVVIQLLSNVNNDATAVDGGKYEVTITNTTNIIGYRIQAIDTLFGDINFANHSDSHTSAYAKDVVVEGLDADGNAVSIAQSKITALTTSDNTVIKVDSANKKVWAIDEGTATISAWMGSTKVADLEVTASIAAPQGQSVTFANESQTIDNTSGTATLNLAAQLTVKDQYGVTLTSPESLGTWSSDDPSVATVDATGKVTAVANGTATITFVLGNGNDVGTVTVNVTNTP